MSAGPIVIKVGGATVEDPLTAPALWRCVARVAERSPVVLVHGGGRAVDRQLERLGMATQRREGIRITPPEQVEQIAGVLAGVMNKTIVGELLSRGVRAVGLCLGDGNAVPAAKATRYSFDAGRVGEVEPERAPTPNVLGVLLGAGFTPVLSSIGIGPDGGLLNVNADDAAAGVARVVRASMLALLTDVPGILDAEKRVVGSITPEGIEAMITSGVIGGGMIPKARAAGECAGRLGAPVLIMPGNSPEALELLGAGRPVGTRVLPA